MAGQSDEFDLQRFVNAQDGDITAVLDELRAGQKLGHWIWYIFPQMRGLGHSSMAHRYGIGSREEARAYAEHPVLGPRLTECTEAVLSVDGRSLDIIFGSLDAMKFRSSMTLFSLCAADPAVFRQALEKYCDGELDPLTIRLLGEK